jgi:phosphoglycolate phosphatase
MVTPAKSRPKVLITDLDNTLWDWFAAWHESFLSMLERLSELSGIPQEILEAEMQTVHQLRSTSEYSNLLNELPSLVEKSGDLTPLEVFDDAIHVLNKNRKQATKLYPGVATALRQIRGRGVTIVAYTESVAYWTEWRIKHTGLDGVIHILYSAPDHDLPSGITIEDLRRRPQDDYGLKITDHRHVPRGEVKPNAKILAAILDDLFCDPGDAVYVGDSLMKDIRMAQAADVLDVHAKYGEAQQRAEYELLRRVSHWPDEVVARERQLMLDAEVTPTIVLRHRFDEVLPIFGISASCQ